MHGTTNPYQDRAVATASPAALVSMLYQRVLVAIERVTALGDLQAPGSTEVANRELQRAQDIVTELRVTLDHHHGGEIAQNLDALYAFCLEQLLEANMRKDPAPLDVVRDVIGQLHDAWQEATVLAAAETTTAPTGVSA